MTIDTRPNRPWSRPRCSHMASFTAGVLIGLALLAGCDRAIVSAPTGQEIATWTKPFDRQALEAAMPYYRAADLSGYTYSLLLVIQNYNASGVAVTLEVNGQDFERRYVAGRTQEIFEVTADMVLQTEAALGLSSTATDPRLLGRACPFAVRLKQYIAEDGYVMQNTDFILAPANIFENMSTKEDFPFDTTYTLDGHIACPGAFAIILRNTYADIIELDRESIGFNEENDDDDVVIGVDSGEIEDVPFEYHPQTIDALTRMGLDWLLISG